MKKTRCAVLAFVAAVTVTLGVLCTVLYFASGSGSRSSIGVRSRYWFAVRAAPRFDRDAWGAFFEDACACHVYYKVVNENTATGDVLLFASTSLPLHELQSDRMLLSTEWSTQEPPECFAPVHFNPSCVFLDESGPAAPPGNGSDVTERRVVFSEIRAQTETGCLPPRESVYFVFVLFESEENSSTWSVVEFEIRAGCYDTSIGDDGTRGKPEAFREAVASHAQSVMVTVSFQEDGSKYHVLLSSDSLSLPTSAAS